MPPGSSGHAPSPPAAPGARLQRIEDYLRTGIPRLEVGVGRNFRTVTVVQIATRPIVIVALVAPRYFAAFSGGG